MNPYIYGTLAVLALFMLFAFKKSGRFLKALLTSILGGIGSVCAVGALSYFLPLSVGLNVFTVIFCAIFSVPGTIFLLLVKTFLF